MKKGTVFTNIVMFISIISMYLGVVYTASHNITTLISLAVLTIISLVILVMCFSGLNKISDMTGAFKKVRKKILNLHVQDPEYVWEALSGEQFAFKNSILDSELNNFKKEMSRLEDEGSIYCQADIKDYINEDNLFVKVRKTLLDSMPKVICIIGIVGTLFSLLFSTNYMSYDVHSVLDACIEPALIILGYTCFLSGMFLLTYKNILANMRCECSLFISDFYKFVVPCAKNDMANNILYLQQLQMQNTEKISENFMEIVSDNLNNTVVRQSEKYNELSIQLETMNGILNRFNDGVDALALNIKDLMENERVLSKAQIDVLKDCLEQLEKKVDAVQTVAEEKPAKKTTRKRATKTKKSEEEAKAETAGDNKDESVEAAPVRKKRGRKSKAEKEAELRAAMELAKKEAESKKAEEALAVEEKPVEEVVEEKPEEKLVEEVVEEKAEEKPVEEVVEEKTVEDNQELEITIPEMVIEDIVLDDDKVVAFNADIKQQKMEEIKLDE